ncbi:MAG: hypothetical protein UW28_C0006G0017 [Parcubacteria group bacterium GW2011_GWA2_44_13]|nr:MAG: hypothetical protein UW28_C0006G0017 [Parcubacteria group bacterium GW2011_GWA2_44_13]
MTKMPKTIIMPIYNGARARSIFNTDIYGELISDDSLKLVIACPSVKVDFYRENFPASNVVFEAVDLPSEHEFGRVLSRVAFNLLPTSTIRGKHKIYYHRYGNYFKFFILGIANRTLGQLPFIKNFIRFLDKFVPLNADVAALFEKYHPDLLIAPDIVFPPDRIFMRVASRSDVYTVGMARSWDNLTSKGVVQKREDVFMAGPPQFDRYYKKSETTREQFLKGLGISPEKRVVLAAPFFDRYTGSAVVMINGLLDAIKTGKLPKDIQILVRYRPGTPPIAEGLLKKSENLTITVPCEVHFDGRGRLSTTEDFEWRKEDVDLLMNSLRWSDVVINTVSTLSVDASVYDKPVINVRFDAEPSCPPMHSVMVMLPNHDHYKAIEASGGVKLVGSMDEMISAINAYLKNPKLDAEGRERLRQEQIVFMDGKAGHRIADFIKGELVKF